MACQENKNIDVFDYLVNELHFDIFSNGDNQEFGLQVACNTIPLLLLNI